MLTLLWCPGYWTLVDTVRKAVCEDLCANGGRFTSVMGPVLNPYDKTRMTGGSSSGSAALVRQNWLLLELSART